MLAGLGAGVWNDIDTLTRIREVDRKFAPTITASDRRGRMKVWKKAVKRAQNWCTPL
jgi:glycerol kinase